jgi:hypothetical protein
MATEKRKPRRLARLAQGAALMTLACDFRRPVDPPHVLDRVRENLPLVDIICHQIRRQLGCGIRMDDIVSYGREGLRSTLAVGYLSGDGPTSAFAAR